MNIKTWDIKIKDGDIFQRRRKMVKRIKCEWLVKIMKKKIYKKEKYKLKNTF